MHKQGNTMSKLVVVKHNKVIEAAYKLTLAEQRVLLSVIAKLDSTAVIPVDAEFCIDASEIRDIFGLHASQSYRDLQQAVKRLYDRTILIRDEDEEFRWLSWKKYDKGNGRVFIQFSQKLIPYLSQLKGNFTKYKLETVREFKTEYGIRFFEILTQWQSKGEREVSVEWLRDVLRLEDSYKSISDLKLKVIEPALQDINTHSNLWVEYGQRKTGRVVSHFQFKFGLKSDAKPTSKRITDAQIQQAARPGETTAQVIARLSGNDLSKVAKPGETIEQVKNRRAALADAKSKLK